MGFFLFVFIKVDWSLVKLNFKERKFIFFKDFIYLFMRDTEREKEAETQAEGEAGSIQGA